MSAARPNQTRGAAWCKHRADGAFSVLVDRRFAVSTFGFVAGFLIACKSPEHVWHVMSIDR